MKDTTTQNHRAAQIWSVLVFAARHQEIITYATVEKLTGLPKFAIGPALNRIANYCEEKGRPELWTIVVNEESGFPAPEAMGKKSEFDILRSQQRAFAFNWFSHECPSPEDFKKAHSKR